MWTDSETIKCFSNTCYLLLLLIVKIAVRVTDFLLMRKIVSVSTHKAVVCDSEVHKANEVGEVDLWKKLMMS